MNNSDSEEELESVKGYVSWVKNDPGSLTDNINEVIDLLSSDDSTVRVKSTYTLAILAKDYPGAILPHVDELLSLLNDTSDNARINTALILSRISQESPEVMRSSTDPLFAALDDSEDTVRESVSKVIFNITEEYPGTVQKKSTALAAAFDDSNESVRTNVSKAVVNLTEQYPKAFDSDMGMLLTALEDPKGAIRMNSAESFANIGEEYPDVIRPFVGSLTSSLSDSRARVQSNSARALSAVANEYPEEVQPAIKPLVDILNSFNDSVRENASAALCEIARQNPGQIRSEADSLNNIIEDLSEDGISVSAIEKIFHEVDQQEVQDSDYKTCEPDIIPAPASQDLSFSDIETTDFLGGGGEAEVYRGCITDDDNEQVVAVKFPKSNKTVNKKSIKSFEQEAETWTNLDDHEHIVTILDYGTMPEPWLAMEYMNKGSLATYTGKMPFVQAVWTSLSIVRAVRYAQNRGVSHLDLKPENILLQGGDNKTWPIPKVADWGLAKDMLYGNSEINGYTPKYAAPEQFDTSFGDPGHKTDIYQMGAVFYELFTGQPPYQKEGGRISEQIFNNNPQKPTEIKSSLPSDIDDVLLKALETQKHNRYEDIILFRKNIEKIYNTLH